MIMIIIYNHDNHVSTFHSTGGEGLYVWRPVPPSDLYVALGQKKIDTSRNYVNPSENSRDFPKVPTFALGSVGQAQCARQTLLNLVGLMSVVWFPQQFTLNLFPAFPNQKCCTLQSRNIQKSYSCHPLRLYGSILYGSPFGDDEFIMD